jgi:hypothetical protein
MSALLPESRMGLDLGTAVQRDFFQFFHLRVCGQQKTAEGHTIAFAPTAPQFRERVSVIARVDEQGRFRCLTLHLDRSVIDDEDTEAMARDIVKSFLADATPVVDIDGIRDWIVDIASRHDAGSQPLGKSDLSPDELLSLIKSRIDAGKPVTVNMGAQGASRPTPAGLPSPAYEVFTGERDACEAALSQAVVRIVNELADGRYRLAVRIAAAASA